jgi:hypothetical protein
VQRERDKPKPTGRHRKEHIMAIAKATCTCKTCGKLFEVRVTRNNRSAADSFEAWAAEAITECYDCKREREEAAAKAAAEKALSGYQMGELIGSPKQITWVEKIRTKAALAWNVYMDPVFVQWVLSTHTDCRWWIDNRNELESDELLNTLTAECEDDLKADAEQKQMEADAGTGRQELTLHTEDGESIAVEVSLAAADIAEIRTTEELPVLRRDGNPANPRYNPPQQHSSVGNIHKGIASILNGSTLTLYPCSDLGECLAPRYYALTDGSSAELAAAFEHLAELSRAQQ